MNTWHEVTTLEKIPPLGARVITTNQGDIALFRTAEGDVFALRDRCPHKGGSLSQGIVFGRKVACPLHNWNICLEDGKAVKPDVGCTRSYPVRVENNVVYISLPGVAE